MKNRGRIRLNIHYLKVIGVNIMYRQHSHRCYPFSPIPIHPYLYYPYPFRQLPEVKPDQFVKSAQNSLILLTDARTLMTRFQSKDYARRIMQAAQSSNTNAVNELLRTSGITHLPKVKYNPDGITLDFDNKNAPPCCYLTLKLRWSEI